MVIIIIIVTYMRTVTSTVFIRRHWRSYEDKPDQGFENFLEWCIDEVRAKQDSAHAFTARCSQY